MNLMTGDEKHDPASYSTLDVIRVLYERVLDVSPDTVDDPRRDRFLLSKGHGPMAYYAVLCDRGLLPRVLAGVVGVVRLAARPPPRPQPGARRRDLVAGRSGTGCRSRSVRRSGLRAQGIGSRVVVLVGDAELDEGSNHEALELAAALGLDALTVVVVDNRSSSYAVPGRIAERFATEGWHVTHRRRPRPRRPGEGAVRARTRRTERRRRHGARRGRGGGSMTTLTRDPRTQFGRTVTDLLDEDLSTALVLRRDLGAVLRPTPLRRHPGPRRSTSASASSCWSTSAPAWP